MATIVSLSDVKAHLRYPTANTADDVALQGFINAASDVINAECGIVVPQRFNESYDGGDFQIWLRHIPIVMIENIEEGWGFTNYELAYVPVNSPSTANMFAYSLDEPSTGLVTRRSGGNVNIRFVQGENNIQVTYTAGRDVIPGAIRLAALELIAHWWQGSQQRSMATGGGSGSYDNTNVDYSRALNAIPLNQGVPYRILELLKPFRRLPIIG
jgi:hypothetical protein